MTLYSVTVKCSHCHEHTFIEEMDTNKFRWLEGLLTPVLHALVCEHCREQFGREGKLLRRTV